MPMTLKNSSLDLFAQIGQIGNEIRMTLESQVRLSLSVDLNTTISVRFYSEHFKILLYAYLSETILF